MDREVGKDNQNGDKLTQSKRAKKSKPSRNRTRNLLFSSLSVLPLNSRVKQCAIMLLLQWRQITYWLQIAWQNHDDLLYGGHAPPHPTPNLLLLVEITGAICSDPNNDKYYMETGLKISADYETLNAQP